MSGLNRNQTTFYFAAQAGKGSAATMTGDDAVELTYDSAGLPFKPTSSAEVERNNIRDSRLPQAMIPIGKEGATPNPLGLEMHAGVGGAVPEFGLMIKSLLGVETSGTYSIGVDNTWYSVESYVGNGAGTGVKCVGLDARCREWGVSATVNEIITQTFGIRSLTATESDANDVLTPNTDDQVPIVASCLTFTVGGVAKDAKSLEFTVSNPSEDYFINSCGLGDISADTPLEITGTMVVVAESDEEMTKYFASTLSTIILSGTGVAITLTDCQYNDPEYGDDEKTVEASVTFTAVGGITAVFS